MRRTRRARRRGCALASSACRGEARTMCRADRPERTASSRAAWPPWTAAARGAPPPPPAAAPGASTDPARHLREHPCRARVAANRRAKDRACVTRATAAPHSAVSRCANAGEELLTPGPRRQRRTGKSRPGCSPSARGRASGAGSGCDGAVLLPHPGHALGLAAGELAHAGVLGVVHEVVDRVAPRPRAGVLPGRAALGRVRLGGGVVDLVAGRVAPVLEGVEQAHPVA